MPKITKRLVDGLPVPPKGAADMLAWDSELRGFGVRVKAGSGVRSFLLQYRNREGRSRRYTIGRYGPLTVDQARDKALRLLGRVTDGEDPADERSAHRKAMTVKALCAEYLQQAEAGLLATRRRGQPKKASTIATDRGRIERHIVPLLGSRKVVDLKPADVTRFLQDVAAGKTKADVKTKKRGRARVVGGRGTATRTVGLLQGILSYAVSLGIRADNPAHGVRRFADQKRKVRLTAEQYKTLGQALDAEAEGREDWAPLRMIRLIALTGCRRGEVQALRWAEVDHGGRCLRLEDSKTGASVRPLGQAALDLLVPPKGSDGGDFVFTGATPDKPYGGLPKACERIAERAGLADLTLHALRHSFASVADDLGFTEPTIAALLGHAGGGVTRGYIHKLDAAILAAADRVAASVDAMMRGQSAEVVPFKATGLPAGGAE